MHLCEGNLVFIKVTFIILIEGILVSFKNYWNIVDVQYYVS